MRKLGFSFVSLAAVLMVGCGDNNEPVNFDSQGAEIVRQRLCAKDWEVAARKGTAAETFNASTLWSVSPYQLLVPSSGEGYARLTINAPHYDWLLYTTSDVHLESLDGPKLTYNGPVSECPELGFVEYGAHHQELTSWLLSIEGQGLSRARFYAGLAATDHSDPEESGHEGGVEAAPDHAGH